MTLVKNRLFCEAHVLTVLLSVAFTATASLFCEAHVPTVVLLSAVSTATANLSC